MLLLVDLTPCSLHWSIFISIIRHEIRPNCFQSRVKLEKWCVTMAIDKVCRHGPISVDFPEVSETACGLTLSFSPILMPPPPCLVLIANFCENHQHYVTTTTRISKIDQPNFVSQGDYRACSHMVDTTTWTVHLHKWSCGHCSKRRQRDKPWYMYMTLWIWPFHLVLCSVMHIWCTTHSSRISSGHPCHYYYDVACYKSHSYTYRHAATIYMSYRCVNWVL